MNTEKPQRENGIDASYVNTPDAAHPEEELSKKDVVVILALSLLALTLPSIILHLCLFTLPDMLNDWFNIESVFMKLLSFVVSVFVALQLIKLTIMVLFRMGGPIMLLAKLSLFIGFFSIIVRAIFW